jgi:CheY-like chemotaxis protein
MSRVGLLEDNYRIAKLSAIMLGYAGHEVTIYTEAFDCLRALSILDICSVQTPIPYEHAQVSPLPIDVLILDLHLPTMSGLDVVRLLRTHPSTCTLPLIFCTAATSAEVNLALSIVPEAYLVEKPFKLQTLVMAIAHVLPEPL